MSQFATKGKAQLAFPLVNLLILHVFLFISLFSTKDGSRLFNS